MMNFNLFKVIFILSLSYILSQPNQKVYDFAEKWAIEKGININPKLKMEFKSINNKTYISRSAIEPNETLLTIPKSIILTPELILSLSGKKLKKNLIEFSNEFNKTDNKESESYNFSQINQDVILAVAQYLAIEKEKGALYEKYSHYFNTYEDNLDSFPIFYTQSQNDLLINCSISLELFKYKQIMDLQLSSANKYFHGTMDIDTYQKYWVLSLSKSININGTKSIVPFLDFFDVEINPQKYNAEYNIDFENNEKFITIKSTREIKPNETIILHFLPDNKSNLYYLVSHGRTFEGNFIIPKLMVPYINPKLYYQLNQNNGLTLDMDFLKTHNVDMTKSDFFLEVLDFYKDILKQFDEKHDKFECLQFIYNNFNLYVEGFKFINEQMIRNEFFTEKDINNIERIFNMEYDIVNFARNNILKAGEEELLDRAIKEKEMKNEMEKKEGAKEDDDKKDETKKNETKKEDL